jgi:hypothetical protein
MRFQRRQLDGTIQRANANQRRQQRHRANPTPRASQAGGGGSNQTKPQTYPQCTIHSTDIATHDFSPFHLMWRQYEGDPGSKNMTWIKLPAI